LSRLVEITDADKDGYVSICPHCTGVMDKYNSKKFCYARNVEIDVKRITRIPVKIAIEKGRKICIAPSDIKICYAQTPNEEHQWDDLDVIKVITD
jgi:hypothetical protein